MNTSVIDKKQALQCSSPLPFLTIVLAVATFLTSVSVATYLYDFPWKTVPIKDLRVYGGLNRDSLANGELWRLVTSQLVHVKQAHMLFNVLMLYLLGAAIEKAANPIVLFAIWIVSGVIGTYVSIYSVPPPWEVGTGASQAVMGLSAACVIVVKRNLNNKTWLKRTILVSVGLALAIDFVYAGYPKPGHIAGFVGGYILGYFLLPKTKLRGTV